MKYQDSGNAESSVGSMNKMESNASKNINEEVEIKPMDVLCGRGKNSFNHGKSNRRQPDECAILFYVNFYLLTLLLLIVNYLLLQLETGNSVKLLPLPFRVMLPPCPDRPNRKS